MVGYTPPNRYQPRPGWKVKLDTWVQFPPPNVGSWQNDIGLYWRWTTTEGASLQEAWARLKMSENNAATSLGSNSADRGLIPPELFSRVLARSGLVDIDPDDDEADVILDPDPTPPPATEDGFHAPNRYKPNPGWKAKLDGWLQFPPAEAWKRDIMLYWRKKTEQGKSSTQAWMELRMAVNNAQTALDRNSLDRGMIPPELFSRVLARSRAASIDPDDDVADVIIDSATA